VKDVHRVIQWATGSVGQIAIRHLAANAAFELVGAYVTSEAKHGKDAGELAGIPALGVCATNDIDEALAIEADCVHYAPLHGDVGEMCRILRSGKNLVTPVGFAFPDAIAREDAAMLEEAAQEGGVSLFGTGIHPGFAGDLLPLTFARLHTRIDAITVTEVADLRNHPSTAMTFDGLGFGRDPQDAVAVKSPIIRTMDRVFVESMSLVAAGLGIDVERFTTDFQVAAATRDLQVRSGRIAAGCVAGMRFSWKTWSGGRPVIVFDSFWKMADEIDPDWGYDDAKYSVVIEGEPGMKVRFEPTKPGPGGDIGYWGRMWTTMAAVNAIPEVCAAPPGIRTHLDLPLVRPRNLVP
jgi:hypothetical protein